MEAVEKKIQPEPVGKFEIHGIIKEKCIDCRKCVEDCPSFLFDGQDGKVEFNNPYRLCIKCGHCIAVCPTEAIDFEAPDTPVTGNLIIHPEKIDFKQLSEAYRGRRSIRSYIDKPVPKEIIGQILNVMQYAPSASNKQRRQYIVMTDTRKIEEFSKKVIQTIQVRYNLVTNPVLNFLLKLIRSPYGVNPKFAKSFENTLNRANAGEDPIFFGAPCVILLHSPEYWSLAGNDAGVAFSQGMLAAQSLGLGTCWAGFAEAMTQRVPKIHKWLHIPKSHKVWGILTLGYHNISYKRAPPRYDLKVRWE